MIPIEGIKKTCQRKAINMKKMNHIIPIFKADTHVSY